MRSIRQDAIAAPEAQSIQASPLAADARPEDVLRADAAERFGARNAFRRAGHAESKSDYSHHAQIRAAASILVKNYDPPKQESTAESKTSLT